MPVLFSIHLSTSVKGMGKPTVKAVSAHVAGIFDEATKDILRPDHDAVREALPHYYRKAFDRAGKGFWFNKDARLTVEGKCADTPYLTLRDARGRYLNTVYAIPYRFEPAVAAPPVGSDEWKTFVANAVAKPPHVRTLAEDDAIARAMAMSAN